jgi:sec-independent protein translocase protein TatC
VSTGPLQLGLAQYGLLAVVALGWFLGVVALGYWVVTDASDRGRRAPWFDAFLAVGFAPYILLYLYWRGERTSPPTRRETVARDWAAVVFCTFVAGALFSPPDPATQVVWATPMLLAGGVLVAYRHRARFGGGDAETA